MGALFCLPQEDELKRYKQTISRNQFDANIDLRIKRAELAKMEADMMITSTQSEAALLRWGAQLELGDYQENYITELKNLELLATRNRNIVDQTRQVQELMSQLTKVNSKYSNPMRFNMASMRRAATRATRVNQVMTHMDDVRKTVTTQLSKKPDDGDDEETEKLITVEDLQAKWKSKALSKTRVVYSPVQYDDDNDDGVIFDKP